MPLPAEGPRIGPPVQVTNRASRGGINRSTHIGCSGYHGSEHGYLCSSASIAQQGGDHAKIAGTVEYGRDNEGFFQRQSCGTLDSSEATHGEGFRRTMQCHCARRRHPQKHGTTAPDTYDPNARGRDVPLVLRRRRQVRAHISERAKARRRGRAVLVSFGQWGLVLDRF
jgi:hypothetical protein